MSNDLLSALLENWKSIGDGHPSQQYKTAGPPADLLEMLMPQDVSDWIEFLWTQKCEGNLCGQHITPVRCMKSLGNLLYEVASSDATVVVSVSSRMAPIPTWKDRRIALARGSSSSGLAIDLAPGPDGDVGQILFFAESGLLQHVIASSLTSLIETHLGQTPQYWLDNGVDEIFGLEDWENFDFVCEFE
jgi:cell wall assembly regulator SMI1